MTRSSLENDTLKGDSPVEKVWKGVQVSWVVFIEYWIWIWELLTSNFKYVLNLIANSTVKESWKEPVARSEKILKPDGDRMIRLYGVVLSVSNNVPGST